MSDQPDFTSAFANTLDDWTFSYILSLYYQTHWPTPDPDIQGNPDLETWQLEVAICLRELGVLAAPEDDDRNCYAVFDSEDAPGKVFIECSRFRSVMQSILAARRTI